MLGRRGAAGEATGVEGREHLRLAALARLGNLQFRAREVVDGVISGLHRSPYRGFSVEFSEHREYAPGDDLRHLDWKAYGKFDRYFIKEYEEETNLRAYLLLDASASMAYGLPAPGLPPPPRGAPPALPKFEYAALLAAALATLLLRQQDAVGLLPLGGEGARGVPPRSRGSQLQALVAALEQLVPAGRPGLAARLPELLPRLRRRSLVLVISDLLPSGPDDEASFLSTIRAVRHRKNEVVVFHVLHPAELDFPFEEMATFEDPEDPAGRVVADPRAVRDAYRAAVEGAVARYRRECLAHGIDYLLCRTDAPLERVLVPFLAARS
ncbi:MAG TPA: DUF58 domain-containing protein [Thermodesulfobacteriota bacterium]|nr:DUF58 domain-containing protein [Thermodesulfobacteriota bacterium]